MITVYESGVYLLEGSRIVPEAEAAGLISPEEGRKGTISHGILAAHQQGSGLTQLALRFDSLTSHDITYVGIIQTARASGMERFPLPYVLTNCHNSLCAVGGTINEDDHKFALSAARKYGGVYVPPHLAVIHTYNREMMAACGSMILGSDSHTRYGALGTLAVGEGGGALAKQLLGKTYDIPYPGVVAVYLTGTPPAGVGPHDVALSIIGAVFEKGYTKNKVMEFVGDGIEKLSVDFRNGIDVMTTETACWSSVWKTDEAVRRYFEVRGRGEAYRELRPAATAYYDGLIHVDLSTIEPCIALPFHPSNVYSLREFTAHAEDILAQVEEAAQKSLGIPGRSLKFRDKCRDGGVWVDQGVIAGCSGGIFENITAAADILEDKSIGCGPFSLNVYPDSQPSYLELVNNGTAARLMASGATIHPAFCGPCFGSGDTPASGELSIRHTTRNFPNREGSKPGEGQIATVALMDARSIAATALNQGRITAATDLDLSYGKPRYFFDKRIYENRVYQGTGQPNAALPLVLGPNIKDWPAIPPLAEHLLLKIVAYITDPVTTTDELIPSGETSSYRSNPLRLAEFTLSRKDPTYVERAKGVQRSEAQREAGAPDAETLEALRKIRALPGYEGLEASQIRLGSTIYATKPGDGSAREQAASCQRVLGAAANLAKEYATKRYRSNLINWGMLPLLVADAETLALGDYLFLPGVRQAVGAKAEGLKAYLLSSEARELALSLGPLSDTERRILVEGCLINYYAVSKT
ncbi:MAG: hydratase [Spirochaetaceae bacterium]|jgi:aconitate hydratase|nr:hydratase [Spirochaetaceae bacterium]